MNEEIEHNFNHRRLLEAVLSEPEKVPAIVAEDRTILDAVDCCDETVLHWLAVENHVDGVTLLRSLGAQISPWALVHSMQVGNTEMVILLLELGVEPEVSVCKRTLENPLFKLTKKQKRLMRSYFSQFGYEI